MEKYTCNKYNKRPFLSKNEIRQRPYKEAKFRWKDSKGRELTAGGILPYDDTGIWVIGEINRNSIIFTDIGGKYQYQDCDIYKTIAREFGEELYHSSDMTREQMIELSSICQPVYINGHKNKPVYICYIVHIDIMNGMGIYLNSELFLKNREFVLKENPDVPSEYYSSVVLTHLSFEDINNILSTDKLQLSYRLKGILKYGCLSNKLQLNSPRENKNISINNYEELTTELANSVANVKI